MRDGQPSNPARSSMKQGRPRTIAFRAMRLEYHKLVRDGIPRIIEAGGGQPVSRVLDRAGYLAALRAKLPEEAEEKRSAPDRQLRSELADVLEVLRALAAAQGMSWEDAGELDMAVLPPPGDASRVSCFLADHPRWSAWWDKRYGLWRVAEDDPDSDLYAESSDADTVMGYITAHA